MILDSVIFSFDSEHLGVKIDNVTHKKVDFLQKPFFYRIWTFVFFSYFNSFMWIKLFFAANISLS